MTEPQLKRIDKILTVMCFCICVSLIHWFVALGVSIVLFIVLVSKD